MSRIVAVGTAVPPNRVGQEQVRDFCRALFEPAFPDIDRLLTVFANGSIEERYFAAPNEWFERDHSFADKNRLYVEAALDLAAEAAVRCLAAAGLDAREVDHLLFVSTTGLATPSLDAQLVNRLRMRGHIRRTPIWGLGCAGGAAGLSRAFEYTRAYPGHNALLVAVELCGLTFQRNDLSKSNLVATSLFGDGAAAVLVSGADTGARGLEVLATRSTLWYDSLDVMGWEVNDGGLKVLFSRDIPTIVRRAMLPALEEFLTEQDLDLRAVGHVIAHPGGVKVLEAYREVLGLVPEQLTHAYEVLRRYGNMSSATVLFVLGEFVRARTIGDAELGVVTALGPGFSSEMLLVRGAAA
jgi:alkylresorcinol/alkylpyrone synthase